MAAGDVDVKITAANAYNSNFFDGADDYVEIADNSHHRGSNFVQGITLSAWIRPLSDGEIAAGVLSGYVANKSASTVATTGWIWAIRGSSNAMTFYTGGSTTKAVGATNSLTYRGDWIHVLVTQNASTKSAQNYVNGATSGSAATNDGSISATTSSNTMRIGNLSTGTTQSFDGYIRDFKMWNRVLSAAEITADAASKTNTVGLVTHLKLGGNYVDQGVTGLTATASGSVAVISDGALPAIVAAQRGASTDTWLIADTMGSQILTTNIRQA